MELGRVGVWLGALSLAPAAEELAAAREIERLGYGSLWFGEAGARESFTHAATLLAATERIVVGTGIASIWARDAMAAHNGAETLNEYHPGRFVLGLGVSHAPLVRWRGLTYAKPLSAMREYLDALKQAQFRGVPAAPEPAPVVIAALAPKMLELARDAADGAHPYLVTAEHTKQAREVLGPGKLLVTEQAVALADGAESGRAAGREHLSAYLPMENYRNSWLRLGYSEDEFADGGSDRLVDALVAWGDEQTIAARVREHLDAGADHVPVQAVGPEPLEQLRRLAPALLAL